MREQNSITLALSATPGRAHPRTLRGRAREFVRGFQGRRLLADLAQLDDRMLGDVGLTRADLRDAAVRGLLRDPARLLFRRAAERRSRQRSPREHLPDI